MPYDNVKAAQAANGGAYPPDMSVLVKARGGGVDYIYSLLQGYEDAPSNVSLDDGVYYNKYMPPIPGVGLTPETLTDASWPTLSRCVATISMTAVSIRLSWLTLHQTTSASMIWPVTFRNGAMILTTKQLSALLTTLICNSHAMPTTSSPLPTNAG
jgi:hypothetical protein